MEFVEAELADLADMIHQRGRWDWLNRLFTLRGIHTYPDIYVTESRWKYEACCELERRGIVQRRPVPPGSRSVFFGPAEHLEQAAGGN